MSRTPTNFGPYEREYRSRVSRSRHLLKVAVQLILMTGAVVLAGLYLFPMHARTAAPTQQLQSIQRTAWEPAASAHRFVHLPRRWA